MSDLQMAVDAASRNAAHTWMVEKQADRALYALVVHMREEHGMSVRKIAQRTTLTQKHVMAVLATWKDT